eukprot:TRINITY_DN4301_c0_g1_i1.p1 TRINITY_DN4301_c0_g1~~TRINITY_DN4301_c0_g1_i1.p1  ORF type:complete len:137 (-),score=20.37 TRINITY_DN4301_c0_g1_i1:188-598(-)
MSGNPHLDLYRKSTLGASLEEALEELMRQNLMTQSLARKVLEQFDKSINEVIANKVKTKVSFKGNLQTYRFCDNVWTFVLENANFRTETEAINVDLVKIEACDSKNLLKPNPGSTSTSSTTSAHTTTSEANYASDE